MGTDPMVFLTRVTVPFIFGSILVLNMFQNSLLASLTQPLKGIANTAVADLARRRRWPRLRPARPGGHGHAAGVRARRPTTTRSGWPMRCSAITFPLLVFEAVYFDFWPFKR